MCGLVGMAGNLNGKDEDVMSRLLILDYPRGKDSTGLASVSDKGKVEIIKETLNPLALMEMKKYEKVNDAWGSYALIGHNRAATLGGVNAANAHPFTFGDVTGAHNGTLDMLSWKRLEKECGFDTDVDSAAVFASINEVGLNNTIKVMETGNTSQKGAWALTYYDGTDNTINFIRNKHRPLWYAISKDLDKIYWASEWPMIDCSLRLTDGSSDLFVSDEGFSFFPFDIDLHHHLDVKELTKGFDSYDKFLEAFIGEKIEGRSPVATHYTPKKGGGAGGPAPFLKKVDQKKESGKSSGTDFSEGRVSAKDADTVISVLPVDEKNPLGGVLSTYRFGYITENGCSYCGASIHINDPSYTIFENDGRCLCGDCTNDEGIRIYKDKRLQGA